MKKCPYCAEEIQDDALKCRHCNEFLNKSSTQGLDGIQCKQCGGDMINKRVAKHSQGGAILFLFGGIILCFTGVGAIVGIPLILVGLYLGCGTQLFWVCKNCRVKIEKM